MKLDELIRDLPLAIARGRADIDIASVTDDSREVAVGGLFVARPGPAVDGRSYVGDAVALGAAAVLCAEDVAPGLPEGPTVIVPGDGESVARLGARLAERATGAPSSRLAVIGVTGTNGKTTTCFLVQQLLQQANRRCGLIGTVAVDDGAARQPATLTTPGAPRLSGLLASMVRNGCSAASMEVSSHALHQDRVAGLRFTVGVFTNLTGDHLDYHGTIESYAAAKAMLFDSLGADAVAVLNADDPWSERMARDCRGRILRCTLRSTPAEARATVLEAGVTGMRLRMEGPWGSFERMVPLVGRHNAMNALQAAAAAHAVGVGGEALADGLERCTAPPGRLEPVTVPDGSFTVLVDYAHTDDALDNALQALRPLVPAGGRLHVVFGCGGDRDRTKRPRMAAVAWRWADQVTVTSDNPRTEDPEAIIAEVLAGVPADRRTATRADADRAAAIAAAIAQARSGDVLVIAGKGHEDYQIIGRTKRPFDDRLVARDALAGRFPAASMPAATAPVPRAGTAR